MRHLTIPKRLLGTKGWGVVAVLSTLVVGSAAQAAPVVIDDFTTPGSPIAYVITLMSPDPHLIKSGGPGILGGERDLLVDVAGVPGPVAATGVIGGGGYTFGSTAAGIVATLQYDGADPDSVGPPAALINAAGLPSVDLTGGGTNTGFLLSFSSIDGGTASSLSVSIALSSAGTAIASGSVPESATPTAYFIPFSAFTTSGAFSFASVTSVELILNGSAVPDTDFVMTGFAAVPEPTSLALLALGGLGLACAVRRRKMSG